MGCQGIAKLLSSLQDHLAAVEARIARLIAAHEGLATEARRLTSVPGIGPALSAVILARLPELGHLDHRQIARLAGLAPHACDSGLFRGKRRIWGGRADLRRALSLAAFIASRCDPTIKAFRKRRQDAGKPTKLAITARPAKTPHHPQRHGQKPQTISQTDRLKDSCYRGRPAAPYSPRLRSTSRRICSLMSCSLMPGCTICGSGW